MKTLKIILIIIIQYLIKIGKAFINKLKSYIPTLKACGKYLSYKIKAAYEEWKRKELERKITESQLLAQCVLIDLIRYLQKHPFPQVMALDLSNPDFVRIQTIDIYKYDITIPLKVAGKLPNGLFPHYFTAGLNTSLQNDRYLWDSTHHPSEQQPLYYKMNIIDMDQPYEAVVVIRLQLL